MSITINDYKEMLLTFLKEEELNIFLSSLENEPIKGCTYNPYKINFEKLKENISDLTDSFSLGYAYYPYGNKVSLNPLYLSGAIYPMDYSAFCVSKQLFNVIKNKNDLRILDLCSAPGGKSIALNNLLNNNFELMVCNDFTYKRAEILKTNIERQGIKNVVVTSNAPKDFLNFFKEYFSTIILDAPCSGSGMSRKKEKMDDVWSYSKVQECCLLQNDLLETSYNLLQKDGILCYSTCSYSKEEDEDMISCFLKKHQDCILLPMIQDNSKDGINSIGKRYIPGLFKGEGQYCCLIQKISGNIKDLNNSVKKIENSLNGLIYKGKKRLIDYCPKELFDLNILKLGFSLENKEEYSKCSYDWDSCHILDLPKIELTNNDVLMYMKGLELKSSSNYENQIVILTYLNYPLGFGKCIKGKIKNYLPKGLRIR